MAQGTIFQLPITRGWNADGSRSNGAKLSVQLAGTTTPTSLFLDVGLTIPCATPGNPLVADINGVFPEIFGTPGVAYKVTLTDTNGVALPGYPSDNVLATPASSSIVDTTEIAGEAISAGQAVYLSRGDASKNPGQLYKADAGTFYSSTNAHLGVAPNAIAAGASGTFRTDGQVTGFVGLTAGANYYVGTAGVITTAPSSVTRYVGRADGTTTLQVGPNPSPMMNFLGGGLVGMGGRLTINFATGPIADGVTSSIGYMPYISDVIELWDGTGWSPVTFGNVGLVVPNTTNQMYDLFLQLVNGAPALVPIAWTNDTTRAVGISRVNGKLISTPDQTKRYVGSMRTNAVSGQIADTTSQRFLWNYYNRVPRPFLFTATGTSWSGTNNGIVRQLNGNSAAQIEIAIGLVETPTWLSFNLMAADTGTAPISAGIGYDTTTLINTSVWGGTQVVANVFTLLSANGWHSPAIGHHTYTALELSQVAFATTFYGTSLANFFGGTYNPGITGYIEG